MTNILKMERHSKDVTVDAVHAQIVLQLYGNDFTCLHLSRMKWPSISSDTNITVYYSLKAEA